MISKDLLRLSNPVALLFFLISCLAVPLALASPETKGRDIWIHLLLGVAITSITYLFLLPLILIDKIPEKIAPLFWFSITVTAGVIRGLLFRTGAKELGFVDPASLIQRSINSVLTTVFWLTLISFLVESSRRFRDTYRQHLLLVMQKYGALEKEHARDLSYLESEAKSMQISVQNILDVVDTQNYMVEDFLTLQTKLKTQIDSVLRPMSYKIWRTDTSSDPKFRFYFTLRMAIFNLQFPIKWVLIPLLITGFVNGVSIVGPLNSLLRLSIVVSMWLMINTLFIRLNTWRGGKSLLRSSFYLVVIGFVPTLVSEVINRALGLEFNFTTTLLLAPMLPALVVIASFTHLIGKERSEIIQFLEKLTKSDDFNIEMYLKKRKDLAGYLHNSLQSELLSLGLLLEKAEATSDPALAKRTIERLHALLTKVMKNSFSEDVEDFSNRVEQIIEGWSGIADISISLESLDSLQSSDQSKILQLCEEIITNAIRRGKASSVEISGMLEENSYSIEMVSDGVLVPQSSKTVGNSWISDITNNSWTVESSNSGVKGNARLSVGGSV